MHGRTALVSAAAVALLLASCGGSNDSGEVAGTPSAATDDPLTLSLARTGGAAGRILAEDLQRSLEEVSGGEMTIDTATELFDDAIADNEQRFVRDVAAGDVDLGWVGTRAFVELGVTSLEALTAPFLVDSYELQTAILDSDIPDLMLAELDTLGVTGLGVTAGGLRHPIAVEAPLLDIDDYAGLPFYVFRSQTGAETLATLGAVPTGETTDDRDRGLQDGTIAGYEQSVGFHREFHGLAPYLTLNVTLWPSTAVYFANPEMLAGLSQEQRQWLDTAVAGTVSRSVELANVDAELMDGICAQGGRFAEASEAQLATLREAVAPIYAQLEADALTAELIEEISELKQSVTIEPLAIPDGCAGEADLPDSVVAEGTGDPSVLNGTYHLDWEEEQLLEAFGAAGAPVDDPGLQRDVASNSGLVVLTFEDGEFDQTWESGPDAGVSCGGTYAVSGKRLTMVASTDAGAWDCGIDTLGVLLVDAAWELTDTELILSDFVLSDEPDVTWWNEIFLGAKPWLKID